MNKIFLALTLLFCYGTFVYAKWLGCKESLDYTKFAIIAALFKVEASCSVNALGDTIVVVSDGKDVYKLNLKTGREIQ